MAKAMQPQKLYFSRAMQTEKYKNLINNTCLLYTSDAADEL